MRKNRLFILLLFSIASLSILVAQAPYGLEWIDMTKPHYKIPIASKSAYRISYSYLIASCTEIANANPSEICLYNKGVQVPIYISWTSGSVSNSDYIEFIGDKLDGQIDQRLYPDTNFILSPYTSLFKDTNYYYLTLRSGVNARIQNITNDTTAITSSYKPVCYAKTLLTFKDAYNEGRRFYYTTVDYNTNSFYDEGEGMGTTSYGSLSFNTAGYTSHPTLKNKLSLRIHGRNELTHQLEYKVNGTKVGETQIQGSKNMNGQFDFASSMITSGTTAMTTTPLIPNNHGYCLGYAELMYLRTFDMSGQGLIHVYFPSATSSEKINISNYNSSQKVILYDHTRQSRIVHDLSTYHRFVIPATNETDRYSLFHEGIITSVASSTRVNYSNLLNQKGNYIIITDKALDSGGNTVLNELKAFKESAQGGGYKVVIAYNHDLAELFGYGVPKHPLAIRKYLQWAYQTWGADAPQYALLIGKGYNVNGLYWASGATYSNNLIPSFGTVASDYGYTMMDTGYGQFISIGRLSTNSPQIVKNYLEKLKSYYAEYQAVSDVDMTPTRKQYMKWNIHLGGGAGVEQQQYFKANLRSFETMIRDTAVGGRTFSIFKNNPDLSATETEIDLNNRMNKGVSLVTFFGHSSSTIFDVGITDPNGLTNTGKYPIFLANGCNSGYVFSTTPSYSEQFVNLPNKGAIAFVATTNFALDVSMYQFCDAFYRQLSSPSYANSIGEVVRKTSRRHLDIYPQMNYLTTICFEYNINGDPSLPVNHYSKPDYYIDNNSLILPTTNINNTVDSFPIKLIVHNLGKAIAGSIKIHVERINGSNKSTYDYVHNAPYYIDTVTMYLPTIDGSVGIGLNNFNIKVDADNTYAELSENNNEIKNSTSLFIESEDVLPIFPYTFSIVGKQPVSLVGIVTTTTPKLQRYIIQIDTTELFNSSFLNTHTTSTEENTIRWALPFGLQDSVVYYWRICKDTIAGSPARWGYSSFIYIPNQPDGGWNQSHYYQLLKDDYNNTTLSTNRKFEFVQDIKNILVRTDGSNGTYEVEWYLNQARVAAFREQNRISAGFMVIWMDGKSGIVHDCFDSSYNGTTWGYHGSVMYGYTSARKGFVFQDTGYTPANHPRPNTAWSTIMNDFINQIPTGDYVVIYTLKKPAYTFWDATLQYIFTSNGFSNLNTLTSGTVQAPLIFGYRKNTPSYTPFQKIGTDYVSKTTGEIFIVGNWKEGYITSTPIGPAEKWNTLKYRISASESPTEDTNRVTLYGITTQQQRVALASFSSNSIDTPLQWIDPNVYTQLQLVLYSKDEKDRTPAQLNYWRILYDDIGEVSVNSSNAAIPVSKDTIENGEVYSMYYGMETLNDKKFDSISLQTIVTQGSNSKTFYTRHQPLGSYDFQIGKQELKLSDYFVGENIISYIINPSNYLYQKEKYNFNNYGKKRFYVKSDIYNPLLDVTFDGVHIIQNELVSNSPNIKISIKDENKYLLLDDTALVHMTLKYPDGSLIPVYFNQPNVSYTLASSAAKNKAEINFKPTLTDGLYQLIIKDSDKTGNSSSKNGKFDYVTGFRVITKNQISQFINYPNPFTTATHFIFTLTGSKIPDYIKIQIVNIRGQVVREILKDELGPLRFGLNKTSYAWDGRDQYGDLLANGVYLYRVIVRDGGQDYPMMDEADQKSLYNSSKNLNQYFTNGWGKMVIIR